MILASRKASAMIEFLCRRKREADALFSSPFILSLTQEQNNASRLQERTAPPRSLADRLASEVLSRKSSRNVRAERSCALDGCRRGILFLTFPDKCLSRP